MGENLPVSPGTREASPTSLPGVASGGRPGTAQAAEVPVPFLNEVKRFVRNLVAAERNSELYPVQGRVVQDSLENLRSSFEAYAAVSGTPLELQVSQFKLLYDGQTVYQDESAERSLAYCMHKDLVWTLRFLPGITVHELLVFLTCFREARFSDDEKDNDFSSLFWEKDLKHIQVETADKFASEDELVELPNVKRLAEVLDPRRFRLSVQQEVRLGKMVTLREAEVAAGHVRFELSAEEIDRISQLKAEGDESASVVSFLDLLFDFLVTSPDPTILQAGARAVRTFFTGLVRSLDLTSARLVLERLTSLSSQDETKPIRFWFKDLLQGLCDKTTQRVISTFLRTNPALPADHEVFRFMRALGPEALPHIVEFLKIQSHVASVSAVLVHLGKGWGDLFFPYLLHPDPQVAQIMVQVLRKIDPDGAARWIASALRHREPGVRLEAIRMLQTLKDPRVGQGFVFMLQEKTPQCIQAALEFFAEVSWPSAFRPLVQLVRSRRFDKLETRHHRLCFKALLLADRPRTVRFISRILGRWDFGYRRRSVLRKEAALLALASLPKDQAVQDLLERTARRRSWLGDLAKQLVETPQRPAERREKPAAPAGKAAAPAEKPRAPAEKPRAPAEKPGESGAKPAEAVKPAAQPGATPAELREHQAGSAEKPAGPGEKPAEMVMKPAEPEQKPAELAEKPAEAGEKPAGPREEPDASQAGPAGGDSAGAKP